MTKRTCALLLLLLASTAGALQLPLRINFQGRLTNPADNNPRNGVFPVDFRMFDDPTAGVQLWPVSGVETQNVTVNNGVFAVQLGGVKALLPDMFAGTSVYLSINVDGDGEMTPRPQLLMAPYAYTAAQLVQNGDIRVNSGVTYSTFTAGGNLVLAKGIVATTATFTGQVTAASATFSSSGGAVFGVDVSSGLRMSLGTFLAGGSGIDADGTGLRASTATLTATGNTQFSLLTSSGIWMKDGTLVADGAANFRNTVNVGSVTVGVAASSASIVFAGNPAADNYIAFPFISGGAITAKQVVVLTSTRTVSAVAGANSLAVAGIAINTVGGAGQTVWVATSGMVSNVPTTAAVISVGNRVAASATAGSVVASVTAGATIGKALSSVTAAGGVILVLLDGR